MRRPRVCSLLTNGTADSQLDSLPKKHKEAIEKKFSEFAGDSTLSKPGILDSPANHLHGLPPDLKDVRRMHAGRHRVFYKGFFSQCSFTLFYVKMFKKTGVNDENDSAFHKMLKRAASDMSLGRVLREPDKPKEQ
jgi:hypothetical protein